MSNISKKVSTILNVNIQEGKWSQMVEPIDRGGEPTRKHTTAILFAICEQLEGIENKLAALETIRGGGGGSKDASSNKS